MRTDGEDDSSAFFVLTHEQLLKLVSSLEERRMRVLYTPITASGSAVRSLLGLGEVFAPTPAPHGDTVAAARDSPASTRPVSIIRVSPPLTRPPSVRTLPTVVPMEEIQRAAAVAPTPATQASTPQRGEQTPNMHTPMISAAAQPNVQPDRRARSTDTTPTPGAAWQEKHGSASTQHPGAPPTTGDRFAVPRVSSRAEGVRVVSHEPASQTQPDERRRAPPPPLPAQPHDAGSAYANIPLVQSLESSFASLAAEASGASSNCGARQLSVPRTRSRQGSPAPAPSLSAANRGGSRSSPRHQVPSSQAHPRVPESQGRGSGGESLSPKRPHSPPKMRPGKSKQNIFLP